MVVMQVFVDQSFVAAESLCDDKHDRHRRLGDTGKP